MNTTMNTTRQIDDLSALSAPAYERACNALFSLWAQNVRRNPYTARRVRALLGCLHRTWSNVQACPPVVAERFIALAECAK